MGKKSRDRNRNLAAGSGDESASGAVGPRQPCPCGSGRRYKACHGSADGAPPVYSSRPFAGMPSETDVVAMREFVPVATAAVTLRSPEYADRAIMLCSLLPGAAPGLVREDGTIWLGLQVQHAYGDPSRDLAAVLLRALEADPGTTVGPVEPAADGARLQDLIEQTPLEVTMHTGFDFWLADVEDTDGSTAAVLEQANASVAPTERLDGVESAYWTQMGDRLYLRWVLPDDEDRVLDAFARLHAARADSLVEGDRMIGMFRAHGVMVPVWDLPAATTAADLAAPAARLAGELAPLLAERLELTSQERAARSGLASRQLTIR